MPEPSHRGAEPMEDLHPDGYFTSLRPGRLGDGDKEAEDGADRKGPSEYQQALHAHGESPWAFAAVPYQPMVGIANRT